MGILGNSTVQNRAAVEAALAAATNEDALPYLVYTALVTQVATASPTAIILENTLGVIPSWSRVDELGTISYLLSSTGTFTNDKTFVTSTPNFGDSSIIEFENLNTNSITFRVITPPDAISSDGYLSNTPIEIRVYA